MEKIRIKIPDEWEDFLEVPKSDVWNTRREWFESHIFHYEEIANYMVGEQSTALLFDVQACFCAGSWISVIALSFSVIESHIRELNEDAGRRPIKKLIDQYGFDEKLNLLRERRNMLVHTNFGSPVINSDMQYDDRAKLEVEAKEAVSLMFEIFYSEKTS